MTIQSYYRIRKIINIVEIFIKGEGHFKKLIFFVNANKNLALSLATSTHRSFSLQSIGFPYEIRPKEVQNSTSLLPFLRALVISLCCPRVFVQMAYGKPFNYHFV